MEFGACEIPELPRARQSDDGVASPKGKERKAERRITRHRHRKCKDEEGLEGILS
jgi:hypothetical protein